MKSLIESLGTSEIQTVIAQLQVEMGISADFAAPSSAEELHHIIAMMPLALFIKDADSHIVLMNPACEAQWGVKFSNVRGTRAAGSVPDEQLAKLLAQDRAAFASGKRSINEVLIWHAGRAENRWVETHKQPLFDQHGQPRLLIAMSIDITDRKLSEQALQASLSQLRALSNHQDTVKDRERRRIAHDIHDNLAQNLLALKLDLTMLHARTARRQSRLHQRAAQAMLTLDASIHAVRDLINELHPATLELGLSAAIEWQLQQLEQRHGLRCRLQVQDDSATLDQRQTAAIFRLVQAALRYLCSHQRTREVQLTLSLRQDRQSIIVSGDGQPGQDSSDALDLGAIRERLTALGGELAVAPLPGAGTVLHMTLSCNS